MLSTISYVVAIVNGGVHRENHRPATSHRFIT